jgi:2-desacetyl-2-hydroxyethyl bacteriochlorophyllide A dehydrogenase
MKRTSLYFVAPNKVEFRQEELTSPGVGQVQVRSLVSAISAGTELMIYNGDAPQRMAADSQIAALGGSLAFPLKYGYSMVGEVAGLGEGVGAAMKGKRVFAFNPHETMFNANVEDLQFLPKDCLEEDAVFLANMETAVNLILDGEPSIGEKVVVLGQGVVGLLATGLLTRYPLGTLVTMDAIEMRRDHSQRFGAQKSLNIDETNRVSALLGAHGADLVYELSGNPEALNTALDLVGEHGRIVVGSWYGRRTAAIKLGEKFHRGRIKIISSQVSQIEPSLRGRWDKTRRFDEAWKWIKQIKPSQLVSHRFHFEKANEGYQQLSQHPDKTIGVLLQYPK